MYLSSHLRTYQSIYLCIYLLIYLYRLIIWFGLGTPCVGSFVSPRVLPGNAVVAWGSWGRDGAGGEHIDKHAQPASLLEMQRPLHEQRS